MYSRDKKISRRSLADINSIQSVNLYPFEHEALLEYRMDTPFPETLFIKELTSGGAKTIYGERVIESLAPPTVHHVHLLEEVSFENGMALASLLAYRLGDKKAARGYFYKSCLFAARCLVVLASGKFPLSYQNIHDEAINLGLGEYEKIVRTALTARSDGVFDEETLFQSLNFLVRKVRREIMEKVSTETHQ